jgi:ABC-type transporter Mla subunit MlaD
VHAALSSGAPVDEELQDLLRQLDGDIHQLLEQRAANGAVSEEGTTTYGLAERTQEISAKFAAKHPALEPTLRELGRILGNMGI